MAHDQFGQLEPLSDADFARLTRHMSTDNDETIDRDQDYMLTLCGCLRCKVSRHWRAISRVLLTHW